MMRNPKSKIWLSLLFLAMLAPTMSRAWRMDPYPLPEDRGAAGILAAMEKLPVYARVLHITAHPDDEDAATLTWLSRRFHAQTALFCLTRGEGGQNALGSEKYEALGLIRTGELWQACRYYGTELYFGRAVDFGFSKTAQETLSKWGREETLADIVRFIRRWRPAIILSRFRGLPADGHGHHQAAGILAREAFHAAGDPRRFPEQMHEGLAPWRPKKLYISHSGEAKGTTGNGIDASAERWTVRVPVGDYSPILGRSYREIASEGYSRHRTQGMRQAYPSAGPPWEYYRLAESAVGYKAREDSFFDSLDTSLGAVADLAGAEGKSVPFLRDDLGAVQQAAVEAVHLFEPSHPEKSAEAIARGIQILTRSLRAVEASAVSDDAKAVLTEALGSKRDDFQKALTAALGIQVVAATLDATGVPGERVSVNVHVRNRGSESVKLKSPTLRAPGIVRPTDPVLSMRDLAVGDDAVFGFSVDIAENARATEAAAPREHGAEARRGIRSAGDAFAPFAEPEMETEVRYVFGGMEVPVGAAVRAPGADPGSVSDWTEFQILPALSVTLHPPFRIVPAAKAARICSFRLSVTNNGKGEARGRLKLTTQAGWRTQPADAPFVLGRKGESFSADFSVRVPAGVPDGIYLVEAVAVMDGIEFHSGHQAIFYPGIPARRMASPARSEIRIFNLKAPLNRSAGYIPGAGDEIPAAMQELGVRVQELDAEDLASGDLKGFPVIVTGIRAFNVNEALRRHHRRLLEYVRQGGTLIVQYVRPEAESDGQGGSPFPFAPYPMRLSASERITVEDSPVRILDPKHPLFTRPNKITEADFQNWVQERGLYFMHSWDGRYQALLSGNDPGEEPKNGGMLCARYGKGYFVYTGYAWFRQLPAGIPGAFRIFANLISLGRR